MITQVISKQIEKPEEISKLESSTVSMRDTWRTIVASVPL